MMRATAMHEPCPYCGQRGWVTRLRVTSRGFEIEGRCHVCGYACDSEYNPAEISDDLACEMMAPGEADARD